MLNFGTFSVKGCWGQVTLLFFNLVNEIKQTFCGTTIQENYGSVYPSEPFTLDHFFMKHPVLDMTPPFYKILHDWQQSDMMKCTRPSPLELLLRCYVFRHNQSLIDIDSVLIFLMALFFSKIYLD